ncbi:hypothetical protein A2V82_03080 [candidate division KSB1 bacterium RBG_16_48_16]|nr:MAG: hypothetical protein A2V82_03080 [candidate division KSB1 bacterium RBG_16_48_16]
MSFNKVKFIHNPKSGLIRSPLLIRKVIEFTLSDAKFEFDFEETKYRGHATEIATRACGQGYDAIVAVGGDGTANETASALIHRDVAFGVIPIGSGNGLSRGVDIPLSIRKAARLLIDGTTRIIDAGKIENRYFFIVAGVGFDALVGKLFDDQSIRGPLPYFTIGFREFLFYRPEVFVLKFNGKQIAVPALLITIANTRQWGNGVIIAPKAEPDDGLLDICILHRVKFLYAAYHFPKLFSGKIEKVRKYERFQAREVKIIREKPGPFHVDGEPQDAQTELSVTLVPRALKIIVPKRVSIQPPSRKATKEHKKSLSIFVSSSFRGRKITIPE